MINTVNATVLSGGSAFGLDTASGVVRCLVKKNIGFETRDRRIPIVSAAVLYDLSVGNNPFIVPDADLGYSACMTATNSRVSEGNVDAGAGASIGKLFGMQHTMKAGVGSTSLTVRNSTMNITVTVGVLVAVNALGDIYKNGVLLAGARTTNGRHLLNTVNHLLGIDFNSINNVSAGTTTTIGCIVTDATLTKAQAKNVSQMANDRYARAINPIHTIVNLIGLMVAEVIEQAIIRAVEQASSLPNLPSLHELH
ncbi:hypothetical protein I4U23_015242 [Adineta vaga]|nr:hypothetical protein I4U23_015242 [Adineta vaga]